MEMKCNRSSVLLVSMPFAMTTIPSIQLATLESYLKNYGVDVDTGHLYLKAAECYSLDVYNRLIAPPNDAYLAQIGFIKYVFPDFWSQSKERIKRFYDLVINRSEGSKNFYGFSEYLLRTDTFIQWVFKNIDWKSYDILGFSLNYGQLLPSLAVAKYIKQQFPDKSIVFGGSNTINELGVRILESFGYIDYAVSGEGEAALLALTNADMDVTVIPNLIYRSHGEVKSNNSTQGIDLNTIPQISFDSFYYDLDRVSSDIQQFFEYYGKLPIEISRGCWWKKCTFCNISLQCRRYQEKYIDRFIDELLCLSNKYKMLDFQIIGNTLPRDWKNLFKRIISLGRDFSFVAENRAGELNLEDYQLMKKAGFLIIQTGIESFSTNYLKKMNKGTRVIDNVAALKHCKEAGITNRYNLVVNFPNEDKQDYEETKRTIQQIWQYLDAPEISPLRVGYGSPIFCNFEEFNITSLEHNTIDKILFPPDVLDNNFTFFYTFKRKVDLSNNDWNKLVDTWKKNLEEIKLKLVYNQNPVENLQFYYVDGGKFLKIYDKRDIDDVDIYALDNVERKIFLACRNVVSFQELQTLLSGIPEYQLAAILHTFEKNGIVFHEDTFYLSLPLSYNLIKRKSEGMPIQHQSSGIQRSL